MVAFLAAWVLTSLLIAMIVGPAIAFGMGSDEGTARNFPLPNSLPKALLSFRQPIRGTSLGANRAERLPEQQSSAISGGAFSGVVLPNVERSGHV